MKLLSTFASTVIAFAALTANAAADYIPFYVDVAMPDATAHGYFHGVVGSNNNSGVGAPFHFELTEGSFTATLIGSSSGNNAQVAVGDPLGHTITVTADHVYFDFSSRTPDFLKFYTGDGSMLCFQTASAESCGAARGAGIVIFVAGAPDPFLPVTGNEIIASIAAVPEPATWGMMILGFASVGWIAFRRRNRAAAV
jgi:hypothetical protein